MSAACQPGRANWDSGHRGEPIDSCLVVSGLLWYGFFSSWVSWDPGRLPSGLLSSL